MHNSYNKRQKLYFRQDQRCAYCGCVCKLAKSVLKKLEPDSFTLDHIIPRSLGGSDTIDNLVGACAACNFSRKNETHIRWIATAMKIKRFNLYQDISDFLNETRKKYSQWTSFAKTGRCGWCISYIWGLYRVYKGKITHSEFKSKISSFNYKL